MHIHKFTGTADLDYKLRFETVVFKNMYISHFFWTLDKLETNKIYDRVCIADSRVPKYTGSMTSSRLSI